MIGEYRTTYLVQNRQITEAFDATAILKDLAESQAYVVAKLDGILTVLDMKRLAVFFPATVDMTADLTTFLTDSLTDFIVDSLSTTEALPLKNLYTRKFINRMTAIDPHADEAYSVQYTSMTTPDVRDDLRYREWANDLVITSANAMDNALVSVNGLFHKTTLFNNELFVAGGYANMKRAGTTEMTMLDTSGIGGHTAVPITADMIQPAEDGGYVKSVKIALPEGLAFTGKTVLMVLHGRMLILDGTYQVISPELMKINMNRIDLTHLLIHHPMTKWTRAWRAPGFLYQHDAGPSDPNALAPLYDDTNPLYADPIDVSGVVMPDDLLSNTYITNLLTEGQSFIILINDPNIYLKRYRPWESFHPGQYELQSDDTPRGLLLYNKSWVLPYTIMSSSDHQHTITVAARRLGDDIYKTSLDQTHVEAPWFDTHEEDRKNSVELIELYRP